MMKSNYMVLALMLSFMSCGMASADDKTESPNKAGDKTVGQKFVKRSGAQANIGNIAPYRRDMLMRIASSWHPKKPNTQMTVTLKLARDGKLLDSKVIKSSADKEEEQGALTALKNTEFAALPGWYKGESIEFNVELSKVDGFNEPANSKEPVNSKPTK